MEEAEPNRAAGPSSFRDRTKLWPRSSLLLSVVERMTVWIHCRSSGSTVLGPAARATAHLFQLLHSHPKNSPRPLQGEKKMLTFCSPCLDLVWEGGDDTTSSDSRLGWNELLSLDFGWPMHAAACTRVRGGGSRSRLARRCWHSYVKKNPDGGKDLNFSSRRSRYS